MSSLRQSAKGLSLLVMLKLERRDAPQRVLNLETNETMHLVKKHDLFWIPLKYWGLVCLAVGVYLALSSAPKTH